MKDKEKFGRKRISKTRQNITKMKECRNRKKINTNANEFERKKKNILTVKNNLKNKREGNMKKYEYESQKIYRCKKTFKRRKMYKVVEYNSKYNLNMKIEESRC